MAKCTNVDIAPHNTSPSKGSKAVREPARVPTEVGRQRRSAVTAKRVVKAGYVAARSFVCNDDWAVSRTYRRPLRVEC